MSRLWNAVERTERSNAQLGREVMVVLPGELSANQRVQLARSYAQELADRYRCAVDTAVHLPRPDADERNHHAHFFMTPREVTPEGLGHRTSFSLSGTERHALGLCNRRDDLFWQRERWATVANEALAAAGLTVRIDHCAARKLGKPELRLPLNIHKMELATGRPSRVGEALRQQHRERVEAWSKGPDELARVVHRQKEEARRALLRNAELQAGVRKQLSRAVFNKEELNQQRREQYHADKARRREMEANMSPAQRAAESWVKWRQRHAAQEKTPEQAMRDWLANREAQELEVPSRVATRGVGHEQELVRGKRRELARDYGLEL
jgi:hypothetical protein